MEERQRPLILIGERTEHRVLRPQVVNTAGRRGPSPIFFVEAPLMDRHAPGQSAAEGGEWGGRTRERTADAVLVVQPQCHELR